MNLTATLTLTFACLMVANSALAAAEKVYKWTDAKGQTHYSQHPPLNTETEVIKTQTGHSDPVNNEIAKTTTAAPKDNVEKKADSKDAPLKDKDRCEAAHKTVDMLKTYTHIRIKSEDGQYRFLTPDEQKQKLDEANKAIEESCE